MLSNYRSCQSLLDFTKKFIGLLQHPQVHQGSKKYRLKQREQAEAITKLQKITINTRLEQTKLEYQLDDLATKRNLKELELKVAKDIAESKTGLIRRVVGVGILQMTLMAGLMLKLPPI